MVILGNNLLSANMQFGSPGWSQLPVPISSIVCLLLFGRWAGIKSILWGMVIGQGINLLLVEYFLRREQLSIVPRYSKNSQFPSEKGYRQMAVLMLSAIFVHATLIVNQRMASGLAVGSVAAYGLGFKAILFVTGIVSAAISFVVLPYFSRFIVSGNLKKANKELTVLLMALSVVMVPISLGAYTIGRFILSYLLVGGVFKGSDIVLVGRVMEMGILQLPFYASMLVLVKFETALGRSLPIYLSAFITMCTNIVLNYALIPRLGVAGIALANTLAVLAGCSCQLFFAWWKRNLDNHDFIAIILNWILYLTLVLCIIYRSFAGVFVSCSALGMLFLSLYLKFRADSFTELSRPLAENAEEKM